MSVLWLRIPFQQGNDKEDLLWESPLLSPVETLEEMYMKIGGDQIQDLYLMRIFHDTRNTISLLHEWVILCGRSGMPPIRPETRVDHEFVGLYHKWQGVERCFWATSFETETSVLFSRFVVFPRQLTEWKWNESVIEKALENKERDQTVWFLRRMAMILRLFVHHIVDDHLESFVDPLFTKYEALWTLWKHFLEKEIDGFLVRWSCETEGEIHRPVAWKLLQLARPLWYYEPRMYSIAFVSQPTVSHVLLLLLFSSIFTSRFLYDVSISMNTIDTFAKMYTEKKRADEAFWMDAYKWGASPFFSKTEVRMYLEREWRRPDMSLWTSWKAKRTEESTALHRMVRDSLCMSYYSFLSLLDVVVAEWSFLEEHRIIVTKYRQQIVAIYSDLVQVSFLYSQQDPLRKWETVAVSSPPNETEKRTTDEPIKAYQQGSSI